MAYLLGSSFRAKFVIIAALIALVVVLQISQNRPRFAIADAQNHADNFYDLLTELNNRMQNENLLVSITLHTPIARDQKLITIGYGYEDINMGINEIGQDYVCLREIQGGAEIITCLLYTNIAGIDYINN